MIFEYGEGTVLGLRGFFEMAKIAQVVGDTDTAIADFKDTIDSIGTTLNDPELELPDTEPVEVSHSDDTEPR